LILAVILILIVDLPEPTRILWLFGIRWSSKFSILKYSGWYRLRWCDL